MARVVGETGIPERIEIPLKTFRRAFLVIIRRAYQPDRTVPELHQIPDRLITVMIAVISDKRRNPVPQLPVELNHGFHLRQLLQCLQGFPCFKEREQRQKQEPVTTLIVQNPVQNPALDIRVKVGKLQRQLNMMRPAEAAASRDHRGKQRFVFARHQQRNLLLASGCL